MAADEGANQGLFEAHTPAENSERAAKVGSTRASIEADMADLAAALVPSAEPEQQSLLLDEIDETVTIFGGPVKHVASQLDAHRRGRGRPPGSQNKASREFRDTLLRMGHRHPGLNIAAMANADPAALVIELAALPVVEGATPAEHIAAAIHTGALKRDKVIDLMNRAHDMIHRANAELLPYFESKQAQPVDLGDGKVMGVMVIGNMPTDRADQAKTIDLTKFDQPE